MTPQTLPSRLAGDVRLGRGEIEAIALAEQHQSLLLIDEVYARAIAEQMGLQTVGSLGILVEAYHRGNLTSDVLEELLMTIEQRKDIWIQPALCERIRREVLSK
jgi:predicted nucleic acid-binding protein